MITNHTITLGIAPEKTFHLRLEYSPNRNNGIHALITTNGHDPLHDPHSIADAFLCDRTDLRNFLIDFHIESSLDTEHKLTENERNLLIQRTLKDQIFLSSVEHLSNYFKDPNTQKPFFQNT